MSYPPYDDTDEYDDYDEYADSDGSDSDGAGGDGGHPDWPENRKLKATRNVKARTDKARTDLTEKWATAPQMIPLATDPDDVNPVIITGGKSAEGLKTALDDDVWDSPAAEDYRTWVGEGIDAITTMLDYMIEDLSTAQTRQEADPGEKAEPNSSEATWPVADDQDGG